ncbi:MAG: DUF1622 domain-containing protein [Hyphomicrobiales bacterium]|nr:DUF1622 domain-containing protein [Hyphomicrobiales bacterium]
MEHMEKLISELASLIKLAFETASILAVTIGGIVALWTLITAFSKPDWLQITRSKLAKCLVLALELQLAADVLATAMAPSWEQIGKLAAIAAIRTFLNYFLTAEMREDETANTDNST